MRSSFASLSRSLLPLLLLLLSLQPIVIARPTFGKRAYNATLAAIVKQRQTSRHEINYRAHLSEVTNKVFAFLSLQDQEQQANEEALLKETLDFGGVDFDLVRGTGSVVGGMKEKSRRASKLAERVKMVKRAVVQQKSDDGARESDSRRESAAGFKADVQVEAADGTETGDGIGAAGSLSLEQQKLLREAQRLMEARELGDRLEAERRTGGADDVPVVVLPERQLYKRGNWPKCPPMVYGERFGYAHYPGWKIAGDELSGAIPVWPEYNCIDACGAYGKACAGVSYLGSKERCMLKGTKVSTWKYSESEHEADAVDLIGGCSLWANIVPPAMHAVCCEA